jgi:hypothetical protein
MSTPPNAASLTTLTSALQNLVQATNNSTQTYLNVQGAANFTNISVPTIVKAKSGRLALLSVITAGSTVGYVYDATTLLDTSKPLAVIPNTVGVTDAKLPASFGIVVVPGTGQVVSGSYS